MTQVRAVCSSNNAEQFFGIPLLVLARYLVVKIAANLRRDISARCLNVLLSGPGQRLFRGNRRDAGVRLRRRFCANKQLDRFGIRYGTARSNSALVGNIEFRKAIQQ